MKLFNLRLASLPFLALLTACSGDRIEQVEDKMKAIRDEPAQKVTQPPVFDPIQSFNYGAEKLRSPFMPPSLLERMAQEMAQGNKVVPDEDRPKEQLEQFELTQLIMRGIIEEPTGERYALVEDPTGTIFPARVGNHMGKNYGRIVEITPRQVNLIEVVPDGARGFVERPKSILAPEA